MVGEMRGVLHELAQQHRLGGALYFTWQGDIHSPKEANGSAFRCGALSESGKLAVSPM